MSVISCIVVGLRVDSRSGSNSIPLQCYFSSSSKFGLNSVSAGFQMPSSLKSPVRAWKRSAATLPWRRKQMVEEWWGCRLPGGPLCPPPTPSISPSKTWVQSSGKAKS